MQTDVSIILVNYNTSDLLLACIESIYTHSSNLKLEIIVVDNNSIRSPKELLQNKYPAVTLIENADNSGFSRANNKGLKVASGKYILFLNSDTLIIENSIESCMRFMESLENTNVGVIGCKLLNSNHSLQHSFHWSAATFKKVIQENAIYSSIFKNKISKTETAKITEQHKRTTEVEWISGAFLFMNRKTCIENSFFLDEDFFMYSEDVELCRRINTSGYKVIYFPQTAIIHLGGGGANVPLKRTGQLLLSEWLCVLKSKGKFGVILYLCVWRCNHLIDHFLYLKNRLFQRVQFKDKKQLIRRRFEISVFKKYLCTFMFKYASKTSSNKHFLRYNAK